MLFYSKFNAHLTGKFPCLSDDYRRAKTQYRRDL